MSVSEGPYVRSDSLIPTSTSQISLNQSPSESNWANKYEDFDIGKAIGYGSSAVVYEAIYKPLKKRVAVKMIDLDMFERNQIDELRRETALMALSKHPNVLRVYGSFVNGSKLYIVTPYLSAGSCLDIMKSSFRDGFDEVSIATILRQALDGLVYLHKNGHIHRDVKAGNLLMDQYGTVLLGDFGVSSSLSEKGDVRKTFVGTPCWMAPEVMEQAGYNYKADIWSFGITALELATGHAPFAKYPPMKVLMMTLSNAPPTLDRENCKHKYSKIFKEMIDCCLQKDPNKRPSAEKLMNHPFFKQAKRKEYLVRSILSTALPLDQRPKKKIPEKHVSYESTDQWDFDTQSVEASSDQNLTVSSTAETPTQFPLERSKSMIQFEDRSRISNTDRTRSLSNDTASMSSEPPTLQRKHISFGDVTIKDSSTSLRSTTPLSTEIAETNNNSVPSISKKSRFVIDDGTPIQTNTASTAATPIEPASGNNNINNNSITIPLPANETTGIGLGITAAPSSNTTPNPPSNAAEVEVKKGRFSVNQTPTLRPGELPEPQEKATIELKATPILRTSSQDSFQSGGTKSRFGVRIVTNNYPPSVTPSTMTPIESQGVCLSRESSNGSVLSKDSKISRFSIEKPDANGPFCEYLPNGATAVIFPECRKKGRFELTGGANIPNENSKLEGTQNNNDSMTSSPMTSPCSSLSRGQGYRILEQPQTMYHHIETLMKQADIQKHILNELLMNVPHMYNQPIRSRTVSDSKRPGFQDEQR
ncbi:kinase-like protein [Backusella circina FSU 941]|nr:kinase-like protein [Backusella circina FSU 941]